MAAVEMTGQLARISLESRAKIVKRAVGTIVFVAVCALLLICSLAWNIHPDNAWWIDMSDEGTGKNDGSDMSNLCAGINATRCHVRAGNTVYLCNVTDTNTSVIIPIRGLLAGLDGKPITYDFYCPGFGKAAAARPYTGMRPWIGASGPLPPLMGLLK